MSQGDIIWPRDTSRLRPGFEEYITDDNALGVDGIVFLSCKVTKSSLLVYY